MTVASRPSSPVFPRAQLYDELAVTAPPVPTLTNASSGDTDNVADNERLGVCGADGKPINPNKWSKADVLEGAFNIIVDLRRRLDEERLARTLGVPVEDEALDEDDMALADDMYASSTLLQEVPSLSEL